MTVASSRTLIFNKDDINYTVYTPNQSIMNQPVLWAIHGSGGISSCEDILIDFAKENNITLITVDSYTGRGVYKLYWNGKDKRIIDTYQRTEDIITVYNDLQDNSNLVPFIGNKHIVFGVSDGGTVCLRLCTDRYNAKWVSKAYCLYPCLYPLETDFFTADKDRYKVFVGEYDNWTPSCYAERLDCDLHIIANTQHSFFKPGVSGTHKNVINISSHPIIMNKIFESDFLKNKKTTLREQLNIDIDNYRGVSVGYSEKASKLVLGELQKEFIL